MSTTEVLCELRNKHSYVIEEFDVQCQRLGADYVTAQIYVPCRFCHVHQKLSATSRADGLGKCVIEDEWGTFTITAQTVGVKVQVVYQARDGKYSCMKMFYVN